MRFEFKGRKYGLSFDRAHKLVDIIRKDKRKETIESKYPYTTVTLWEQSTTGPIRITTATVGCAPKDKYTPELGRLTALRTLSSILKNKSKEHPEDPRYTVGFRHAMWESYINRNKSQKPKGSTPVIPPAQIIDGQVLKSEVVH